MSIPIRFMTAIISKKAIAFHYPGGMPAFRERYCPIPYSDQWLVGFCAMSGSDLQLILDELAQNGLHVGRQIAVGDMWLGCLDSGLGIDFVAKTSRDGKVEWTAEVADREYAPRGGRAIPREPDPNEPFLGGSGILIPMMFDGDTKRGKVIPSNRRAQRRPPDSGETPNKDEEVE